jgi:Protein of unknown function (DUF2510)
MDLVDLAYNGASHPLNVWQYGLSAMVLGLLIAPLIIWVRMRRAAQFKGPALTGTAQLLSVARAGGLAAFGVMQGTNSVIPTYTKIVCRIGLRVEIPGRAPYDVTVTTPVGNTWLYNAKRNPGGTYVVQVDSANPENVRFDYLQPVGTPPGWYPDPSGAQAQRYWDGRQWTASVQPPQH